MKPIILKLGGSVITQKDSDIPELAMHHEIDRIAKEISSSKPKQLILVHGAGSYGHPQAIKYKLKEEFSAKGVYVTHASVKKLNAIVLESLNNEGIDALPIHPLCSCLFDNGKLVYFQTEQIKTMLENDIVPVLHGDVVMDKKKGAIVLSGDKIIKYLALSMSALRIGIGSNTDGVLDDKRKVIRKLTPFNFENFKKHIMGSSSTDVTGGMLGKVSELLELSKNGISSQIFNAKTKGNISEFLQGKDKGTLIAEK